MTTEMVLGLIFIASWVGAIGLLIFLTLIFTEGSDE
jgi:hypothetical protein